MWDLGDFGPALQAKLAKIQKRVGDLQGSAACEIIPSPNARAPYPGRKADGTTNAGLVLILARKNPLFSVVDPTFNRAINQAIKDTFDRETTTLSELVRDVARGIAMELARRLRSGKYFDENSAEWAEYKALHGLFPGPGVASAQLADSLENSEIKS